jgi:putative transcriptional regulator
MKVNHHASDELLLAYAAGQLSPAPTLVVASHLTMSEDDADRLSTFEQIGGALIDEQPLADIAPELFERMLARLDVPAPMEPALSPRDHGALDMGIMLPAPLAARSIGKWRTIAPGIRFADVGLPEDPAFKVVLLRVDAGTALPQHGHSGREMTLVLKGHFNDLGGVYGPGDFDEEDSASHHQPVVTGDGECICLTAIEGRLKPSNLLARIAIRRFGF